MLLYAKFFVAVVVTVITGIVTSLTGDNSISPVEWVNIAIMGVGALGVFAAPNVPGAMYTKTILAVLSAVLVFLTSAITDGISMTEWLQIAIIAAGAVGIYAVPNSTAEKRSAD